MDSIALPSIQVVDSYFPPNPQPAPLPHPDPSRSFWLYSAPDCNPLADHGRHDPLPDQADIAIIGSGISGITTLYHLVQGLKNTSRSVTRIAVLEARQFCGGATGRNGGHCTCYNPVGFATEVAKYGLKDALAHAQLERRAVDFVMRLIKDNGWEDDVDLQQGGNIHLISTQEEHDLLARELKAATDAGIDTSGFEWLTSEECSKLSHCQGNLSGLRLPGNNLYPLKLITKIFQLAQAQAAAAGIDVTLHTYTPVLSVSPSPTQSPKPLILQTHKGALRAGQVVHATNAYASHLLPQLATGPRKIVPCRGQVVAVKPTQTDPFWSTGFSYNEGFEYFFQRPSQNKQTGRTMTPYIILGGGRSVAPEPHELDLADDSVLQPQVEAYLERFLPHHFPKLFDPQRSLDIDFAWTGIMGFTESRNPLVGRVFQDGKVLEGQYMLAGFSGHGMSRSPSCAEVVAAMLLAELQGKEAPLPQWLPTHFLTAP